MRAIENLVMPEGKPFAAQTRPLRCGWAASREFNIQQKGAKG